MKTRKSMFNLIEITMAIAVVGIGIAAIMALFPPAIEANRVANTENYIGGIVDSMAAMVENQATNNWSALMTSLPTIKPSTISSSVTFSTETTYPGIYTTSTANIFGVKSQDESFNGHILIWRGAVESYENPVIPSAVNSSLASTAASTSVSAKVFIELSWPIAAPYDNREKRVYVIELFRGE